MVLSIVIIFLSNRCEEGANQFFLTQVLPGKLESAVSGQSRSSSGYLHASPVKQVCAVDFKIHFMLKYIQWFLLIKSSTAVTVTGWRCFLLLH